MNRLLFVVYVLLASACATVGSNGPSVPPSPFERRSADMVANDREIETDINDELNNDKDLLGQVRVSVTAYNGAVLLVGEAVSEELRNKVVGIARVVSNVKLVHNNIAIAYPSGLDGRSKDLQMTEKLKVALKQIRSLPNFDSSQVKVVVENGSVYLMGIVHRSEGAVAINVIRHQPDVQQIITVFEYLD